MTDSRWSRFGVLRQPALLSFLAARLAATLAAQILTVAIGWQVYAITGDPLDLGLIGLSQFLPFVLLILPAGHVADRYRRSRIVTLCYATEALCAALLLALTLRGMTTAWPVFAVMLLMGAARAFSMPAGQALLPNLVTPELFGRAVALNSSVFQIATVAGPALGGVLYLAGAQAAYSAAGVLALLGVALMSAVRSQQRERSAAGSAKWDTLLSGLRFVRSKPIVLGAISLDLFAVLFGGAMAMLPVYASDILNVGPAGLGLLRTAQGIGASLCAVMLALHPIGRHAGGWMFGGVAVFGLAILVFGLTTHFGVALIALIVLGAADMVSVYVRHVLVQLETPDQIRGRVSAVSSVFIGASNELGDFRSGVMAAWLGAVRAVVIGGFATLIVTGLWIRLFPSLWKMDRFPQPARMEARSGA